MTKLAFSDEAWEDYQYWIQHDRKKLLRINKIIQDTMRNPFESLGSPEPLRFQLQGCWSRRIDEDHRLVYEYRDDTLYIVTCKDHY